MENFIVRPLVKEDALESEKLGVLAWLGATDLETEFNPDEFNPEGMMGLVTPENQLAAYLQEIPFELNFDGNVVGMNGIACVGTRPEHRYGGAIKRLFAKVWENSAERGQLFSMLFPFSCQFYRKFGYESFCYRHYYKIENSMLIHNRVTVPLRRVEAGEDLELINSIHDKFIEKYNMGVRRTIARAKHDNRGDTYKDLVTHFILDENAYVTFRLSRFNPSEINVIDWAYTDEKYVPEILALFGRYSPMIKSVNIHTPADMPLEAFVDSVKDLTHTVAYGPMVRLLDVEKGLSLAAGSDKVNFTIKVTDDGIAKNNGTWRVCNGKAELTEDAPDIECDIRALAPMLIGTFGLNCAKARKDVKINGNYEELAKFFVEKNVYMDDSF